MINHMVTLTMLCKSSPSILLLPAVGTGLKKAILSLVYQPLLLKDSQSWEKIPPDLLVSVSYFASKLLTMILDSYI